jgi:transcriptional regulator GlxA family with amidase domain
MTIVNIEHALSMLRMDLVQRFAHDDWNDAQVEQVARTLVACLRPGRDAVSGHPEMVDPKLPRDVLRRSLRYVNDNLDSRLTWDEIAAAVEMNTFIFGRRFKLSTGMTPRQYVVRCRVRRAMKLLADTKLSIAEIALEVGCSCQSHLTNLFRKYAGTTPSACRTATRQTRRDTTATGGSPLGALPKEIAGTSAAAASIRGSL